MPAIASLTLVLIESSLALFLTHGSTHWLTKPARIANLHVVKVFYWFINHRAPLYVLIASAIYFCVQFSVTAFVHNQFGKDYFAAHYVYPAKVKVEAVKPKNLVLIYVESLEDTYKDPKMFGKDLLTSLSHFNGVALGALSRRRGLVGQSPASPQRSVVCR